MSDTVLCSCHPVQFSSRLDELEELLSDNRVWKERTVGVGILTAQNAWDWGCSGPLLRASGDHLLLLHVWGHNCCHYQLL